MNILEVSGLLKRFDQVEAVSNVSLSVTAGEIYGLLGPNGAGKTTTISMVCGLLKPDAGTVTIVGKNFWSNPQAAQRDMGVVPQEIALYEDMTGRENLAFWGRLCGLSSPDAKTRASDVLDALTLTDRGDDVVKKYSGGMKRRINIGCALMHRPKLLLLDEPTVGIDPQARLNILEFVESLAETGTAVLYTTHYLEEAERLCHRIGIIDHGKLLAEGSLGELQAKIGSDRLFVLEGDLGETDPANCTPLTQSYRVIQSSADMWIVSPTEERHPSECLRELLELPLPIENVTVKKPTLNDLFLQLTGRGLRE